MKNATLALLTVALAISFSANSMAAETKYSNDYKSCMNATDGNTWAMKECIVAETVRWDNKLNANYKAAMKGLAPGRQEALRKAQRAWVSYRDAYCGFKSDPDGGQEGVLNSTECVLSLTAMQAVELGQLIDQ